MKMMTMAVDSPVCLFLANSLVYEVVDRGSGGLDV